MNDLDPSNFEDLAARYVEGELDDAGRAELLELIRQDPPLRTRLSNQLALSQAISDLKPGRDEDVFVRDLTRHVVSVASEDSDVFVSKVTQRVGRPRRIRLMAVAATVAILGVSTFLLVPRLKGDAIARLVQLDAQGREISSRDVRAGFKNTLESGLCRLDFGNGAVVALEGPASYEVLSPLSMRIHSGKLNAWCPESAHGFQVLTKSAKVTDLGTSFCVSARDDGSADYMVLVGQIEVSTRGDVRRISQGVALESDASKKLKPLDFEPSDFSRTWPLASGILSTAGSVRPAPPGTPEQLARLENNDAVMVVPERRDVPFSVSFPAELVDAGTVKSGQAANTRTISVKPGARLRSYLIRYNPIKSEDHHWEKIEGEVTFDRPIVAVCALGSTLDQTDALFATGSWKLPAMKKEFRGIDLDQPPQSPDRVTLSADRRTVHVLFNAAVSTDEVRVLIEEPSVNLP
ncbi:hypothetical protein KBB96_19370 [Luteolibacter ambystomatis]|uniref:FecR protein domain-containing protein n=1 Tax=Luteolibacter ambystomatis TaxID=2824561 RepID=A0A975IZ74_9BACT|nr:hypothetical protein [Luteolibacter ambystomatis]QUE51002.1 hypothetical protein KBB96_19370 [Luteolibacter ambystomatis]